LRYQGYLAGWIKRLAWQEVAMAFHTSWHIVCQEVERAVAWGRAHLNLDGIQALGIDEMQYGRGHQYLTAVYQIDGWNRRLLWLGEKRTVGANLLKEKFQ